MIHPPPSLHCQHWPTATPILYKPNHVTITLSCYFNSSNFNFPWLHSFSFLDISFWPKKINMNNMIIPCCLNILNFFISIFLTGPCRQLRWHQHSQTVVFLVTNLPFPSKWPFDHSPGSKIKQILNNFLTTIDKLQIEIKDRHFVKLSLSLFTLSPVALLSYFSEGAQQSLHLLI